MRTIQPTLLSIEQVMATTDDYYTPKSLFDQMGISFDLDVASPPGGIPWIPAKKFYTMADDGLESPWEGRVWMNPPYSNPTPWVDRFIYHRNGIALLPWGQGEWSMTLWSSDCSISRLPGQFKFHRNGGLAKAGTWAVSLYAFGPECVEAISRVGKVR